ncbi:putative diacylglycerol O-acyltransferase tgs1 [Malassezia yamatoensis]|uniref:Trimethylguanosine synthase n=1 Tax=Malassezia yamatoensis TaxID=253288 RepID=A0AAJ5YS73_9BASI|nr:putative diacylglycerol O-acyltransferase tgs1 [Malassezia yamatoensis]
MARTSRDRLDQQESSDLKKNKAVVRRKYDLPPDMYKYWHARHDLFSRFSEGILLDTESWYSVTPEAVAYRLAAQCACHTILDAFCGAGGNAIQFAMTCERVVAIDIDPLKIALARHNARIYGVEDKITFLCGDIRDFVGDRAQKDADVELWEDCMNLDFDVIFLSPPWGGVGYLNPALPKNVENQKFLDEFSLSELTPLQGPDLFRLARQVSKNVVLYLPRNTNLNEISQLSQVEPTTAFDIRIEELWLGYKLKALAVYVSESPNSAHD